MLRQKPTQNFAVRLAERGKHSCQSNESQFSNICTRVMRDNRMYRT